MFNSRHKNYSQPRSPFMRKLQQAAFWAAALATFLMWPQLWEISGVLSEAVFSDHVDYDVLDIMRMAVFALVFMLSLTLASTGFSSSAGVIGFYILTRLPVF